MRRSTAPSPWHGSRLRRGWLSGVGTAIVLCALGALARPALADTFVLVVANNRSLRTHLPDLQYADDDAIRYYQLLGALLPGARLSLLASLDTATARSNPSFVGLTQPPTRRALLAESRALAAAVRIARAAGRETTFYFVFAGHGDVEAGQGFIELADARFGARDLDALLDEVGAAESHVIIDSCNSFFMINPRKPGGRRWTSGEGVSEGGASRAAPKVGSFLSTSSEQLTYEWSETQSGIFSYLKDQRSTFSNFGGCVDLYAPGENIVTPTSGGWLMPQAGTSFSSPLIARQISLLPVEGMFSVANARDALLKSVDSQQRVPRAAFPASFFYDPAPDTGVRASALISGEPTVKMSSPTARSNKGRTRPLRPGRVLHLPGKFAF